MRFNVRFLAFFSTLAALPVTASAYNCNANTYKFIYNSDGSVGGDGDQNYSTNCTTTANTPSNICLGSIQYALLVAKRFFANCPGGSSPATFTISFAAAKYDFSNETTLAAGYMGAVDVGGINTTTSQRLVITGASFSGEPSLSGVNPNPPPTTIVTNAALATSAATSPPTIASAITGVASSTQSMSHILFQYLAFAQSQSLSDSGSKNGGFSTMSSNYIYGSTQGVVVSYPGSPGGSPYQLVVDITPGFPFPTYNTPGGNPYGLFNRYFGQGRYLRAYTNSTTNPTVVPTGGLVNNKQVPWGDNFTGCPNASQSSVTYEGSTVDTCLPSQPDPTGHPNRWTLYLDQNSWSLPTPSATTIVCIKSKEYWDNSFYFHAHGGPSTDIAFDHVLWIGNGRGVARGGFTGLQITNSAIVPPPPILYNGSSQSPCLSSSEGGPQLGQQGDPATSKNVVANFIAVSLGDNALAFFDDTGAGASQSSIMNTTISDCFAPAIGLFDSSAVYVGDPASNTNNAWSWMNTHNSIVDADPITFTGSYTYPNNNPGGLLIPNPPPNGLDYTTY